MAIMILNIDRNDAEVVSVSVLIDGNKINDEYFFNPLITNTEININIKTDLQNKGYEIE